MIKIYTLPNCKYCTKAKEVLKEMHIPYEEINLKDPKNREAREYYRSLEIKKVPVIEGNYFQLTSFDEEKLRYYLEKYGEKERKERNTN